MNVLIFAPYAMLTPHFETDLEIIQNHLDQGDKVVVLTCNSEMVACDPNRHHDLSKCMKCMSRRNKGISLLSGKIGVQSFFMLEKKDREELASIKTHFSSIEELKLYRIDNFDLGYGVLSSIISMFRNPYPDLESQSELLHDLIISSFVVFRSIQNYLERHQVDRTYVFNGRFAPTRAALRACQNKAVDCFTHDRGHDLQHYMLYENTYPNDLGYLENRVRELWDNSSNKPDREKIATKFFQDREGGVVQSWFSFISKQKQGLLPDDWDPKCHNIVIFCSSEDEFKAIGDEWKNPLYDSQLAALKKILDSLSNSRLDIHLYLRIHPNLEQVNNEYTKELRGLSHCRLTVIGPADPVSTYALLKNAGVVLTFGSTVGIEAVFWGKPSVLAGQCIYRSLEGTYNPKSHEELMELLKSPLPPKDKTAAMKFGYYFCTFGIAFKHFKGTEVAEGKFKGVVIQSGVLVNLVASLSYRLLWSKQNVGRAVRSIARRRILGRFI